VKIHKIFMASHSAWMIENASFLKLIIVKCSDSANMIIYKLYHLHASQHFIHLENPLQNLMNFHVPLIRFERKSLKYQRNILASSHFHLMRHH